MGIILDTATKPDEKLPDIPAAFSKPVKPRARPTGDDYTPLIKKHAAATGLDDDLIGSMMGQESEGKPNATSWTGKHFGLLQTSQAVVNRFVKPGEFGSMDPKSPEVSIAAGTRYMRWLIDHYKGDRVRALAGYNAGEGNADKPTWKTDMERWSNDPQVQSGIKPRGASDKTSTANYTRKIEGNYAKTLPDLPEIEELPDIPDDLHDAAPPPADIDPLSNLKALQTDLQRQLAKAKSPSEKRQIQQSLTTLGKQIEFQASQQGTGTQAAPAAADEDPGRRLPEISDAGGNKYMLSEDQTGVSGGHRYIRTIEDKPVPFVVNGNTITREAPAWVKGKTPPATNIPAGVKPDYDRARDQFAATDSEEFRKKFLEGFGEDDKRFVKAVTPAVPVQRSSGKATVRPRHQPQPAEPPVQQQEPVVDQPSQPSATTDEDYKQYTDSVGKWMTPMSREEFDAAAAAHPGSTSVSMDPNAMRVGEQKIGDINAAAAEARRQEPGYAETQRTVRRRSDANDFVVTVTVDPKWSDEKKTRTAMMKSGQFTSQEIDTWIAGRHAEGLPLIDSAKGRDKTRLAVTRDLIASIKGENEAKYQQRTEQVQSQTERKLPNLRPVPYDFAKTTSDEINEYFKGTRYGDVASAAAGTVIGKLGDWSGTAAGLLEIARDLNPAVGAHKAILEDATVNVDGKQVQKYQVRDISDPAIDTLKEFYEGATAVMDETGGKNPDGTATTPTQVVRFAVGTPFDLTKLAVLSMLPGGSFTAFAVNDAALAKLHGGSGGDVSKAAIRGGITGGLFHFVPPSVRKLMGAGGEEVAETLTHKGARAVVESGLIFGGSAGIGAVAGDPIKENLLNSAVNTAFHFMGIAGRAKRSLFGKKVHVRDVDGNDLYAEIKPDGTLKSIDPQKVDFETVAPSVNRGKYFNKDAAIQTKVKSDELKSNVAAPETGVEPERQYTSQLDEIRQNKADTTAKIQALFPEADLSRQDAAELRRQAWESEPVEHDVTGKNGVRYKVREDRGKQLLVEDPKGSITLQPERKFQDLEDYRSKTPATVTHPNEKIDGKPIVAVRDDGKVVVTNPDNKSGISIVTDRSAATSEKLTGNETASDVTEPASIKAPAENEPEIKDKSSRIHEYSSTQVDLPLPIAGKVMGVSRKLIPDSELYIDPKDPSYGREQRPHITVRWGLHTNDAGEVNKFLSAEKPFKAKLGKISIFEGKDTPYDVVKAEVESEDLHRLNKLIGENAKVTTTFPDSQPHVTLAYVKKGEGAKYVGNADLEGTEISVDKIAFSGQDGENTYISLGESGSATDAAHDAATSPHNDLPEPSQAMKEAGNYRKGHINIGGLDISVENPIGSKRSGIDRDGKPWSVEMKQHYGYIKRTIGADTEHVDVFVKPLTPSDYDGPVYVVDQVHPDTGKFDEHKVMLGFGSEQEARDAYASNYAKDWKGLKSITEMTMPLFKAWTSETVKHPAAETFPSDTATQIRELVDRPTNTGGGNEKIVVASVRPSEVKRVRHDTGIKLEIGYRHVIDKSGINHALRKHGNVEHELKRGQIAITRDDIARVPEIIASPDKIEHAGKSSTGLETIRYTKRFNGDTYYVEEVRTGRKELAFQTLYKRKASDPPLSNAQGDSVAQSPQRENAESNAEDQNITSEVKNERSELPGAGTDAAEPGTPEGSRRDGQSDGEAPASEKEKGEATVADDRETAVEAKPVAKPAPVTPLEHFLADDKAHELTKTILDGTGEDAAAAVAELTKIGKNYGLSEKEVQGVLDRGRANKQRAETRRKTADIVRESREPKGTALEGSATTILTPESSKEYDARYVVREASDIFPSHDPVTFQANPDYYYTNDRHYDREQQYQKQVVDRSQSFKAEYFVTDSPTAADGPPVIDIEGNVLGGNSRAMILRRIYDAEDPAARKSYQVALHKKAAQFGIEASELAKFDRPVLVREISDESINKQHAITELNETSTTDLTTQEQSIADAGKISDETVDYITNKIVVTGPEATLTEALNAHGVKIVNRLIEDGVFGPGERNKLLDNGEITADGKKRIERLLLGKVFTDLDQIENAAPSVNNTIVRIVAPLMKVNEDHEWNILPDVQEGIELLNEAKAAGQGKNIEGFASNINFLRPEGWSPQAIAIAEVLNRGQVKAAEVFKQYSEDMRLAKYGADAMFDLGSKTQAEAYRDAFGVEPRIVEASIVEPASAKHIDEPATEPAVSKDSERTTDTPQDRPDASSAIGSSESVSVSESTVENNAAAPKTIDEPEAEVVPPPLDLRAGDRVKDDFGRKGVVFQDKRTGELHVEQDGTKARLPLSNRWSLVGKRPIEMFGFKKGDVVQKKNQLGKVYERGGQLRVKWTKDGKVKSEPLTEKWAKGSDPEAGSIDPTLLTLGLNKTIAEDVAPGIKRVGQGLKDAAMDIRSLVFAGGRGEAAKLGATSLRAETGKMARSALVAETALKEARKYFAKNPVDDNYDFIAHIESDDLRSLPPAEQQAASELRRLLDESRDRVQALGTGKLDNYIEHYFPHIWKDPTAAASVFQKILAKRPFEGSKSFLKKRVHNTFQQGLDAGLIPVSDNPVDLALLKMKDMDRYVAAHRTLDYGKRQGLVQAVMIGGPIPDGFVKIDDKISTIHGNPTVQFKEAFDAGMMRDLEQFAEDLKIPHDRVLKMRGEKWGYAQGGNIVTRFGGPESVIAHEIGHVLDHRYGLAKMLVGDPKTKVELRNLADLRYAGNPKAAESFKKYVRKGGEKMAVMFEALIHAPDLFAKTAPNTLTVLKSFIKANPELEPLLEIKPTLVLNSATAEGRVHGMVIAGHWYAAEPFANIVNNYLSPGITGSKFAAVRDGFKAWRYVGNLQNQAQLGLSGFHAMFTTLDAVTSKAALAINQATSGHPIKALASLAELPVSPITNLIRGDRVYREGLTPGSTDPFSQAMANWVAEAGGRFKMDDFYHTKAAQKMTDAFRHGNILGGIVRLPAGALDIASRPLMEWLVPRQKLGVFADLMKHEVERMGPTATTEQMREVADRVWDTVDNRMGQMVYDNLFWNKTIKDLSMASVRSVGWNLGDIRELGGAAKDVITLPLRIKRAYKEGKAVEPIVTYRMAYAAALPFVAGIVGAVTNYMMTGKPPQELKDYFFPRTGNFDENGNPERLSLPTYMKDVYAYGRHPMKTLGHKMHPLIGLISEMLSNKDYYGTEIRHPDDPFVQQMVDAAKHVGETFVPFSVKGAMQEKDRQGSTSLKVLPFFGFTPAPKDVNNTKAEDVLSEIQAARREPGTRTKEQAAKSKEITDLVRMKKKGQEAELQEAFDKAKAAGILDDGDLKTIKTRASQTYLESGVTRLTIDDAMKVYRASNESERGRLKDEMEKKIKNAAKAYGKISDEMRKELEGLGFVVPAFRGSPDHPVAPVPAGTPTIGARPKPLVSSSSATVAPRRDRGVGFADLAYAKYDVKPTGEELLQPSIDDAASTPMAGQGSIDAHPNPQGKSLLRDLGRAVKYANEEAATDTEVEDADRRIGELTEKLRKLNLSPNQRIQFNELVPGVYRNERFAGQRLSENIEDRREEGRLGVGASISKKKEK